MNNKLTATTFAILAFAMASIALVVGLSQTTSITAADAPKGNAMYIFAEGVNPVATFSFGDKTETADFQIFSQTQGFGNNGRGTSPEFTLTKIAGGTPYLYAAVDEVQANGLDGRQTGDYFDFNVRVELVQAAETVRVLQYDRCNIVNYKVDTRTDNEEGYTTGKTGFAITDTFTIGCGGYVPENPQLEKLMEEKQNRKPYQ